MVAALRAATRILASAEFLPRIGSYSGSNSLSRSTPSLLFGRSMTWPFEASTMKSLPRNLVSVLDLVGDSTTTRFLPLALPPRLSSSAASSTGSSGGSSRFANRPLPRTGAAASVALRLVRRDGALAAAFFLAAPADAVFFFTAGAGAPASVRDFLVAMRVLRGEGAVLRLERHA